MLAPAAVHYVWGWRDQPELRLSISAAQRAFTMRYKWSTVIPNSKIILLAPLPSRVIMVHKTRIVENGISSFSDLQDLDGRHLRTLHRLYHWIGLQTLLFSCLVLTPSHPHNYGRYQMKFAASRLKSLLTT